MCFMRLGKYRVLLLNAGSRNSLIKQFIRSFGERAEILVSDSFELAPALYENCPSFLIPNWKSENYLNEVLKLCENENVDAIISLLDPDLSVLSKNKELFEASGIVPIISSYELVELCFDKLSLAKSLGEHGLETVPSFGTVEEYISSDIPYPKFPAMVKPRRGSGSAGLNIIHSETELFNFFNREDEPNEWMIQPFLKICEFGADMYFNLSGGLVDYFVKQKLKMRAGETDKSIAVKNQKIFELLDRLASIYDFRGPIDVDLFIYGDEVMISEINPRFGGGYLHSYEAGVRFPDYILENLGSKALPRYEVHYKEGSVLMKYFAYSFVEDNEQLVSNEIDIKK